MIIQDCGAVLGTSIRMSAVLLAASAATAATTAAAAAVFGWCAVLGGLCNSFSLFTLFTLFSLFLFFPPLGGSIFVLRFSRVRTRQLLPFWERFKRVIYSVSDSEEVHFRS